MTTPTERANIALRNEANELIALIGEKPPHFWRCLAEAATAKIPPTPQAKQPIARPVPPAKLPARTPGTVTIPLQNSRYDEALELIESIEELAEQVPERGQEFAESAVETAKSIGETIEERGSVTPSQFQALENIQVALSNWIRD